MDLDISDNVLLVGEANFSFTLSLLDYCDAKHIYTSCYETKEEAIRKYGADCVESNLKLLKIRLNDNQILFNVDACNLIQYFKDLKFQRIIFMFPHVSGRSNLKKNRALIEKFFTSTKNVLKSFNVEEIDLFKNNKRSNKKSFTQSAVYIALSKGQGGTRFEEDESKRNIKDSWIVNYLAQKCQFLLTKCEKLNEDDFHFYKSTGFRSQGKSFCTKSGLVHKFEPSFPHDFDIDSILESEKNNQENTLPHMSRFNARFLRLEEFFKQNERESNDLRNNKNTNSEANLHFIIHPFVEFKKLLVDHLEKSSNLRVKCVKNNPSELMNECHINSLFEKFLKLEVDDLPSKDSINIFSGLIVKRANATLDSHPQTELNCLEFQLLIHFENGTHLINEIRKSLKVFFDSFSCKDFYAIEEVGDKFQCKIDLTEFFKQYFNISDKRLLFTNDKRNFDKQLNTNNEKFCLSYKICPFVIETCKWTHDLSFWCDKNFNYNEFLDTIRDSCFDLVRKIELIDKYEDKLSNRRALCFRFFYESCDRSLNWSKTTQIQYFLRHRLTTQNKLELR
jgi:hypothetical protein